jgi:hypothetical protein
LAAGNVVSGLLIEAHAAENDVVKGSVQLTIAAAVQSVPSDLAG